MIKKILLSFIIFIGAVFTGTACDLCNSQQPKILRDVAHGTGPQGNFDYIIIWSAVLIVGFTLILSLKYLLFPKETNPDHIKFIPLSDHQKN